MIYPKKLNIAYKIKAEVFYTAFNLSLIFLFFKIEENFTINF